MRNISERPTSQVVDKQQNEHEECGAQAQNEATSDNGELVCDMGFVHDTHVVNTVVDVNGNRMAACNSKRLGEDRKVVAEVNQSTQSVERQSVAKQVNVVSTQECC